MLFDKKRENTRDKKPRSRVPILEERNIAYHRDQMRDSALNRSLIEEDNTMDNTSHSNLGDGQLKVRSGTKKSKVKSMYTYL